MADKLLVVGAGGFIGGFIARKSLDLGFETWVAVRASTSRRYLSDERLNFLILDYDDPASLQQALSQALPQGERWRYIIYNLGATKCANFMDFNRINFQYLRNFVTALQQSDLVPERFLYMSSLSALGPGDEKDYTPLTERDIPQPNTRYGLSKIKAESYLDTQIDFPYIIFRPTGVYGPHEKDYLMMIKSIDSHFDFGVGFRKQMLTFIYVEDLVDAMFQALDRGKLHARYNIAEGRAYTQSEFRKIVAEELGGKWVIPVRLPMWAVYAASVVAEKWGQATMKPSTLNRDKFKIMRQRNWDCDISAARRDFGFAPRYDLRRGIHETVKAYISDKQRQKGGGN
ncbi:MAG: NAD(P)-dependent oxidoreductase [Muribaculaceae bacterium]|nr:NAD(P)-dependent oxidoreductase [Muribaculaceae bacterium]